MKHHTTTMCDELGITLDEVVVSGGGASSPLFMQIFADVFALPASRSKGDGGAGLGAAICAASAVGLFPDVEAADAAMIDSREMFAPDPANAEMYRRMNESVYQTIRDATDPVLERSFPLFH